jgi:hypothetical protein
MQKTLTLPALVEVAGSTQQGGQTLPKAEPALPLVRQCSRCIYWVKMERTVRTANAAMSIGDAVGECRRRAPGTAYVFPRTHLDQWCGEFAAQAPQTEDRRQRTEDSRKKGRRETV